MANSTPYFRWSKSPLLLCFLTLILSIPFPVHAATRTPAFEVPTNERAADILPPELVSGPNFRVRSNVVTYVYMHSFVVDSDFGLFEVTGDFALRKLIREIGAIAALQQVKKGQAYMDGLKKAASQPLQFGASLLTDPVDTISGVPKGVARLFDDVKIGMTTKPNPNQDSSVKQALAVSSNKRELASRLGIDVYSSNKVLQKELNGIAWATSLGSLTLSAALAPVGGPAVAAVSITRASQQLSDLLRECTPQKLRDINEQKLLAMGVPSDVTTQFLDHNSFSPTHQTIMVHSLEALTGARGRDAFFRFALRASDEEGANYFMNMAELLRIYGQKSSGIREISVYAPLLFAKTSSGAAFIPLPLDHGIWTERASQRIPEAISAFKGANRDVRQLDAWVTGTTSKRAKDEFSKLGVQITDKADKWIELVF